MENQRKEYFRWLCQFVYGKKKSKFGSYDKLLDILHNTEFTWTIDMDSNRADDGKSLRRRFGLGGLRFVNLGFFRGSGDGFFVSTLVPETAIATGLVAALGYVMCSRRRPR